MSDVCPGEVRMLNGNWKPRCMEKLVMGLGNQAHNGIGREVLHFFLPGRTRQAGDTGAPVPHMGFLSMGWNPGKVRASDLELGHLSRDTIDNAVHVADYFGDLVNRG